MVKEFSSVYSTNILEFIALKKKLGYIFKQGASVLFQIDCLAVKRKETSKGITKSFSEEWCKKRPSETNRTRSSRVSALIQFSNFLKDLNIESYIPKAIIGKKNQFIPYIYSKTEIENLFKASDNLRFKSRGGMTTCIMAIPVLLRLLYSTGLRINEALSLKINDININEQYLKVKDSKNGKERLIPMSNSMSSVCNSYLSYRNMLPLKASAESFFFVKLNGEACTYQGVTSWFKKCLDIAGIHTSNGKKRTRLHDLRHTFAVTSLANMAEDGIDLYASLPILSTYLGHQSLDSTNYYVRITANMYPELLKRIDIISIDIFPNLQNDE